MIDANGNRAEMIFDGFDRQKRWIFPSNAPGFANPADYEEYGYDLVGNRTSLRKHDGSVLGYHYDGLNRVIVKMVPERAGLTAAQTRDVYYDAGLRTAAMVRGHSGDTTPVSNGGRFRMSSSRGKPGQQPISSRLRCCYGRTPSVLPRARNMALRFLTDAEIGDAELVVELDFDGLQSWLRFAAAALEARHGQLTQADGETPADAGTPAGGALHPFSKVTVRFADTARSDPGGQPEIGMAGGARGSGDTACWEMPRHGT